MAKYVAATGLTAEQMLANYRRIVTLVTARPLEQQVSRDIDDDTVLACAVAAKATMIVSGDDDLLVLEYFSRVPIVAPNKSLRILTGR